MATIITRNNKLYLRYYDKITGTKKDKALGLQNNREGLRLAKEQKKLFEANLLDKYYSFNTMVKNRMSIDEAAALFSEVKKHSVNTKYAISIAIKYLKRATNKEYVSDLDRMDFQKFNIFLSKFISEDKVNKKTKVVTKGKPLSQNSKAIYTTSISVLFSWLVTEKYVKENYVVQEKREAKQIEVIPEQEFEHIKYYLLSNNLNAYRFIRMLELTGLRKSSALTLRWEQINFKEETIMIENVKKKRIFIFPLTEEIVTLLKEIGIKDSGKIFSYSKDGLKFWDRTQKFLGFKKKYGLHQIRKTFISNLANSGVSLYDVATLADHRNIQTTYKYYAKSNIDRLKKILNQNNPSPQTSPQMVSGGVQ